MAGHFARAGPVVYFRAGPVPVAFCPRRICARAFWTGSGLLPAHCVPASTRPCFRTGRTCARAFCTTWCLSHLGPGLGHLYGLFVLFVLFGLDLCIFLGRPSLELLQQGFGRWLTDFGLALISSFKSGSNFVARRRFACCRQQSRGVGG